MRRLMLLRHAKSDWTGMGARDHERVLAQRGRETAPRIGAYMARHGLVPDLVICSTATRTRQTWDIVAAAFRQEPDVVYDDRLYEAGPDALQGLVKQTRREAHALLLVGHNPGLQKFAERMIASGDIDARQRLLEKYPTAALAVIDFAVDDWNKLHPMAGRLDRFVIPRMLEAATD